MSCNKIDTRLRLPLTCTEDLFSYLGCPRSHLQLNSRSNNIWELKLHTKEDIVGLLDHFKNIAKVMLHLVQTY